jgi:hypothetical protein
VATYVKYILLQSTKISSTVFVILLHTPSFLLEIRVIIKISFHGNKQKKKKMADSKKFHGLVLELVGLIDAKGIDVAQPIWLKTRSKSSKTRKKCILLFLGHS